MKAAIKWRNTWSQETGYVGSVSAKDKNFQTADKDGAKVYATETAARTAHSKLKSYGQGEEINNEFELEER